jgi:aminoglycoside phosphotransferase (APT) family kinase protein
MHELDDETVFAKVVASLEKQLHVTGIYKMAVGNEFYILRADLPEGAVVIKIPKDKVFSNVNDAHIESRALLDQEFALMRHAKREGITQIPEPIDGTEAEGYGALIMSFVSSDDSKPDEFELGKLLAKLHSLPLPNFDLSAQEGSELPELIANRLHRRWRELAVLVDELPMLPDHDALVSRLEPVRNTKSLLHMDFRRANFRMDHGQVVAILDWSNALVGHPALELARMAETGEMSENGRKFLEGYASVKSLPKTDDTIETISRLDTATMLALVFLSEDPDPEKSPAAVERVLELSEQLLKAMV